MSTLPDGPRESLNAGKRGTRPTPTITVHGGALEDEIAAVVTAVTLYLDADLVDEESERAGWRLAWVRAGRLEAQGIPCTSRALRREWNL